MLSFVKDGAVVIFVCEYAELIIERYIKPIKIRCLIKLKSRILFFTFHFRSVSVESCRFSTSNLIKANILENNLNILWGFLFSGSSLVYHTNFVAKILYHKEYMLITK
jgi:hypothetical protein